MLGLLLVIIIVGLVILVSVDDNNDPDRGVRK
jgi:hypothetical protein